MLVLPRENGHPPRSEFLDRLATSNSVIYPWLPGFHGGDPASWDWLADSRDLAVVLRQFIEAVALERRSSWASATAAGSPPIATMAAGQLAA